MKRIYCAVVGLSLLAGCASEERPTPVEIEPAHGTVIHQTSIESREYVPEAQVVRVPKLEQYMVRGTWHWEKPEIDALGKCSSGRCPVETKPDLREVERQQVPENQLHKGEK